MARIQHVTLTVPAGDLEAAEAFYAGLGGTPLVRPPMLAADTPGRWIGFGDTQLHLVAGGPPAETEAHFAVDLGAAFDAVLASLEAAGAPVRHARRLWGARRAFVRDPAGNLVELFESPPESVPRPERAPPE